MLLDRLTERYKERRARISRLQRKLEVQDALSEIRRLDDWDLVAEFDRVVGVRIDLEADLRELELGSSATAADVRGALDRVIGQ